MRQIFVITLGAAAAAFMAISSPMAQSVGGDSGTMKGLLRQGFEIMAMAPNGAQYVVLLQKGKSAYACEFVTVSSSRCRSINNEAE